MNHTTAWACASIGSCITGIATYAIPILQVVALTVSIIAGLIAIISGKSRK